MTAGWLAAVIALGTATTAGASPEFEPRGRLHLDTVVYAGDEAGDLPDGFNNRRARLGLGGSLGEDWDFQLEFDFAEEGVGARDLRLRRSLPAGRLSLGQFKAPMGLNQLTSSNNITFIERSPAANIVPDAFRIGVGYDYVSDLFGVQTMLYGRGVGDGVSGDMPIALGARGFFSPTVGAGQLHLGVSGAFEDRRDETAVGLSDRPEARGPGGGVRLIDTGTLDAEALTKGGLELAFLTGPFSAEAEYLGVYVDRDGVDNVFFAGFHVQASYVLTGESRGYGGGTFGRPSPEMNYGAWEVAARFSHMDLDDADVEGGTQRSVTVGLNWYVNDNLRFMLNDVLVFVDDGVFGDQTVNIVAARLQYHL